MQNVTIVALKCQLLYERLSNTVYLFILAFDRKNLMEKSIDFWLRISLKNWSKMDSRIESMDQLEAPVLDHEVKRFLFLFWIPLVWDFKFSCFFLQSNKLDRAELFNPPATPATPNTANLLDERNAFNFRHHHFFERKRVRTESLCSNKSSVISRDLQWVFLNF